MIHVPKTMILVMAWIILSGLPLWRRILTVIYLAVVLTISDLFFSK